MDEDRLLGLFAREKADPDFSFFDAVKASAATQGWAPVFKAAFDILQRRDKSAFWYEALVSVYAGHEYKHLLPGDFRECIARMYWCLGNDEALDNPDTDNMVWSMVHGWLGLPYTDGWGPSDDPDISQRIERMDREG